jgi:cystathionine beta-lyase/cystathionine gamma-synthase
MQISSLKNNPVQIILGPRTQKIQTVLVHGPKHMSEQTRLLGRDVPGAIHGSTSFAYPSVETAREGFGTHTSPSFNRMENPDLRSPYGRFGSPNIAELEVKLLYAHGLTYEDNYTSVAFASGMAAVSAAILTATNPGDTVIFDDDLYGCSGRFAKKVLKQKFGRDVTVINVQDNESGYEELRRAITAKTTAIYVESETNPHLKLNNIPRLAKLIHEINTAEKRDFSRKLRLIVDNTFLGPLFCRPFELTKEAVPEDPEIIIIVESLTKIISGFGLDIAGAVIAPNSLVYDQNWEDQGLIAHRDILGGILSPHIAFEISNRSLPTYIVRAKEAEQIALRFAQFLETLKGKWVSSVTYPGIDSYPQRNLAQTMITDYDGYSSSGYMIGFNFFGNPQTQKKAAVNFMNYIAQKGFVWNFMVSLGQVRSLAEVPAAMTHYGTGLPMFARLSIGTESPADIIDEANAAFEYAYGNNSPE